MVAILTGKWELKNRCGLNLYFLNIYSANPIYPWPNDNFFHRRKYQNIWDKVCWLSWILQHLERMISLLDSSILVLPITNRIYREIWGEYDSVVDWHSHIDILTCKMTVLGKKTLGDNDLDEDMGGGAHERRSVPLYKTTRRQALQLAPPPMHTEMQS